MVNVIIDTSCAVDKTKAEEWIKEPVNVYADMDIEHATVSRNKITFNASFAGMYDTEPDDIKQRIDEYLYMNQAFQASNVSVR